MPDVASEKKTQAGAQAAAAQKSPTSASGGNAAQKQAQSNYMKSLRGGQDEKKGDDAAADPNAPAAAAPDAAAPEVAKKATGLENYQAVLGKYLGEKLYGAVAKAVTPDKMKGYADSALNSSIGALMKQFGKLTPETDPKALEAFGNALNAALKPAVDDFMSAGPGKELAASLSEYVDAHPREIATLAILAAIGMVVANAEIPALKSKFQIAQGVNAKIEAKLGTFQNISLEQIKARIEAEAPLAGGTLKTYAEIENTAGKNGGPRNTKGGVGADWQNKDGTWSAGGRLGMDQQHGASGEAYVRRQDPKGKWFVEGKAGHDEQRGNYGMIGAGFRF